MKQVQYTHKEVMDNLHKSLIYKDEFIKYIHNNKGDIIRTVDSKYTKRYKEEFKLLDENLSDLSLLVKYSLIRKDHYERICNTSVFYLLTEFSEKYAISKGYDMNIKIEYFDIYSFVTLMFPIKKKYKKELRIAKINYFSQ